MRLPGLKGGGVALREPAAEDYREWGGGGHTGAWSQRGRRLRQASGHRTRGSQGPTVGPASAQCRKDRGQGGWWEAGSGHQAGPWSARGALAGKDRQGDGDQTAQTEGRG